MLASRSGIESVVMWPCLCLNVVYCANQFNCSQFPDVKFAVVLYHRKFATIFHHFFSIELWQGFVCRTFDQKVWGLNLAPVDGKLLSPWSPQKDGLLSTSFTVYYLITSILHLNISCVLEISAFNFNMLVYRKLV